MILQMNEPPNEFHWGSRKTPLMFNAGPVDEVNPFGYEPEIVNVFEHFAEPGDIAVDAGASIGFHTCLLSKLVGDAGIVLAFEPQLASFQFLMHHVHAINHLANVLCIRQALWNQDIKELKLWSHTELGYSTFHKYYETKDYETVEGRRLDTLLVEDNDHPRILKIDCEGAEGNVLIGAQRHLTRGIDCVILEFNYRLLNSFSKTDAPVRNFMHDLGYDMFLINIGDPNSPSHLAPPILVTPDQKIEIVNGFHINVLFSTQEKVRERWKTNGI